LLVTMPIPSSHYVPILLTRMAERTAIAKAPAVVRDALTPLFVVDPVNWDYDNKKPKESLASHLAKRPKQLRAAWDKPAFVDLLLLADDGPLPGGAHPLFWLTQEARAMGLPLVPAVSPTRSVPYRTAIAAVVARDHLGVCARLAPAEWPINAPGALTSMVDELGIEPAEVDLMLDLGFDASDLAITALRQQLAVLPKLHEWRSLVVASAGMPKAMPQGAKIHELPRHEWLRYQSLLQTPPVPARIPTFADYCVANPDPNLDLDPKLMSLSASIRYTTGDNWLIAKGKLFKGSGGSGLGSAAMAPVATKLRAHAAYLGDGHCGAETWLAAVAGGTTNGGNPTTWRREGTLHHLTVATTQLATLHGASAVP
jgi:hypothetical protein